MQSLTNLSDEQLIVLYQQGNAHAISILINRYKDKIYTSICVLVKDKHLAEDFFQDTFFKIIDTISLGKYKEEGKFLPWGIMIARNLCMDHFRKIKRTPAIKTSEGMDIFDCLNFSEAGADDCIIRRQTEGEVAKILESLPEDQREVVVMRHYANMSFKEIAAVTNCSINTSLGRMRYALINLRKLMSEKQLAL